MLIKRYVTPILHQQVGACSVRRTNLRNINHERLMNSIKVDTIIFTTLNFTNTLKCPKLSTSKISNIQCSKINVSYSKKLLIRTTIMLIKRYVSPILHQQVGACSVRRTKRL